MGWSGVVLFVTYDRVWYRKPDLSKLTRCFLRLTPFTVKYFPLVLLSRRRDVEVRRGCREAFAVSSLCEKTPFVFSWTCVGVRFTSCPVCSAAGLPSVLSLLTIPTIYSFSCSDFLLRGINRYVVVFFRADRLRYSEALELYLSISIFCSFILWRFTFYSTAYTSYCALDIFNFAYIFFVSNCL